MTDAVEPERLPGVTVVVAGYNHAHLVEQSSRSVFDQDYPDVSVIVTDDASKDDSVAVIRGLLEANHWPARTLFHEANAGVCATFNEALAMVQTEYVAFLAADDWMLPGRLRTQVAVLEAAGPTFGMAHADMEIVDELGSSLGELYSDTVGRPDNLSPGGAALVSRLLHGNWIAAPSVLLRTERVRRAGGYDPNLWAEDFDLWIRLARDVGFVYTHTPVVAYRRSPTSMSGDTRNSVRINRDFMNICLKHLGVDPELDKFIALRAYQIAKSEYANGRLGAREAASAMLPRARSARAMAPWLNWLAVRCAVPSRMVRG